MGREAELGPLDWSVERHEANQRCYPGRHLDSELHHPVRGQGYEPIWAYARTPASSPSTCPVSEHPGAETTSFSESHRRLP
jgi:hypothetical protein